MKHEISYHAQDAAVYVSGVWHVNDIADFSSELTSLFKQYGSAIRFLVIDSGAVLDIAVFHTLLKIYREVQKGSDLEIRTESDAHKKIIALLEEVHSKSDVSNIPQPLSMIEAIGKSGLDVWKETTSILYFVVGIIKEIFLILVFPRRFRTKEIVSQIDYTGLSAVPICALVTFLIGIVIAYLMGDQLRYYGANIFVVDGVAVAMCRELSPILVAIIIAGRSGSAFAAQLGSMRLNQEVEALKVMGLSDFSVLIIPRILALMITMPILVIIGNIFGILGGLCISYINFEVSPDNFIERLKMILAPKHIYVGLGKAPLFALFIASIGCRLGLSAAPNAVSIGQNTTKTVVQGIVSVILLNAAIAIILSHAGI